MKEMYRKNQTAKSSLDYLSFPLSIGSLPSYHTSLEIKNSGSFRRGPEKWTQSSEILDAGPPFSYYPSRWCSRATDGGVFIPSVP
jgi:hypothetical protein